MSVVFFRGSFIPAFSRNKEVKDRNRKFNCFCWREMVMTITAVWGRRMHVETQIYKRRLKSMTLKWSKKSEWEILHPGEHIFHLTSQTLWKFLAVWHPWWCRMEVGETNLRHGIEQARFSRWKARNIDESARHFPRSAFLHGHLSCATWNITLMYFSSSFSFNKTRRIHKKCSSIHIKSFTAVNDKKPQLRHVLLKMRNLSINVLRDSSALSLVEKLHNKLRFKYNKQWGRNR